MDEVPVVAIHHNDKLVLGCNACNLHYQVTDDHAVKNLIRQKTSYPLRVTFKNLEALSIR